jgi:hypothetical protein
MTADEAALAVVAARLDDLRDGIREDIRELRDAINASAADKVSRGEWLQRNAAVDDRFQAQGREISQLRTELASRRAPWWSVGALIVSIAVAAWNILAP